VVVGAASLTLTTVPVVAGASIALALLFVVATSLVAVLLGGLSRPPSAVSKPRGRSSRYGRGRTTQPAVRVTGPLSFGVRQARASLAGSVTLGLAVTVVTGSVAVAVTVFAQGRELAGPSALGAVASARAWVPQGVLAAVSLAAGVVLAVLSRRRNLVLRRAQWASIRAMGWRTADVTRAHLAELAVSALPGLVVGVAVSVGLGVSTGSTGGVVAGSAAGILALCGVVLGSQARLTGSAKTEEILQCPGNAARRLSPATAKRATTTRSKTPMRPDWS